MQPVHSDGQPDPQSILIVLPTWVGDFVMATPMLRAIRARFPEAHIAYLAEPNLRDLIRGCEWMDEVVEWPSRAPGSSGGRQRSPIHRVYRDLVWDLRRRRFDWAVLLPNSFSTAMLARLIGAKRRIGYNRDGRGLLLTDRLPVSNQRNRSAIRRSQSGIPLPWTYKGRYAPLPLVKYFADLAEAIGCPRPNDQLELATTPDSDDAVDARLVGLGVAEHRPLVVISPGAKYGAAKCWSPDRFAAVADRLIQKERAAVIITCGPGEEKIARTIGSGLQSGMLNRVFVFDNPILTLGQLKSLIRRCDLLICNDAGPRHFAKAFNVPVVTVFGPTHPEWTATDYEAERIVRIDMDCSPCQQRVCPLGHVNCMTGVTVDAVFRASRELLATRMVETTA